MAQLVKSGGLIDRVVCVLSYTKWQTAPLVACQVTFPPDALARIYEQLLASGRPRDPAVQLASRTLSQMHAKGYAERRLTTCGAFEYRLLQGCEEKFVSYPVRIKHDAYHKGYVRKSDFANGKRFSELVDDFVSRGILVSESDGNFTLNPNIRTD